MAGKRITRKVLFSKTIQILQSILQLEDWIISVKYSQKTKTKNLAQCEAYPEYKQATITLFVKKTPQLNDYDMIAVAIHEMCHCLLWSLVEWTEDLCKADKEKLKATNRLEEGTVTKLEHILTRLAGNLIQEKLAEEGYKDLDLVFQNFRTKNEQLTKQKNI